jgi:hypothetical protein
MKTRDFLVAASTVLAAAGCTTQATEMGAQRSMPMHNTMMGGMMMNMKNADANSDGALSKEEFMRAHEAMFDRMKNKEGVVRLDQMSEHCAAMMGGNGMMQGGKSGPR